MANFTKNKYFKHLLLLIFSIVIFSILFMPFKRSSKKIDAKSLEITYTNAIDSINIKVVDLTYLQDLLRIDDFVSIYSCSEKYLHDAENYLQDSSFDEQRKTIVVYSMQNLNYDDYVEFFNFCTKLYLEKKISHKVIKCVISPGPEWNNYLSSSFLKFSIRKRLIKIQEFNKKDKQLDKIVKMTLSGKLWFFSLFI